ncbi:MAG: glycosyltransferase family 1 protein, partial [Asticcacaulis sp.]
MTEKLRYCLDAQVLQGDSRDRGIGRYSSDLARAIIKSERVQPEILLNTALKDGFYAAMTWAEALVPAKNIHVFHGLGEIIGLIPDNTRRRGHAARLYDAVVHKLNPDCVHIGAPFDGMGDNTTVGNVSVSSTTIRSATLYDLIPFQDPDLHLADIRYHQWYHERLARLRDFDLLFAISDYTRQVAVETFGFPADRVINISSDASDLFKKIDLTKAQSSKILKNYGITRTFIVHTGILEARKNVKLLVEAFAALAPSLRQTMQLVLITSVTEAQRAEITGHGRRFGLEPDDIVFAGFVPDADLVKIYNLAKLLVMPSLSEGFGLPLLEAMRCGLPVLGADATSIPEVVGDKSYLFDPYDSKELTEKLQRLLSDEHVYAAAQAHVGRQQLLFSWQTSANRCLDAIETLKAERALSKSGAVSKAKKRAARNDETVENVPAEIVVNDGHLTAEQEAKMTSGPFICLSSGSDDITCSAEMLYRSSGYYALYEQKFSPRRSM